jgi:5-methylcytosine-specific restriction endonuclease McrA
MPKMPLQGWFALGLVPSGGRALTPMNDRLRTMPYPEYLRTPEWAEKRQRALLRAGGRCQHCDSSDRLEVHHRHDRNRGAELDEDLAVLCHACHSHHHHRGCCREGESE